MKNQITLITALCLAFTGLTGCADSSENDQSSTLSSQTEAVSDTVADAEPVDESVSLPDGYNQLQDITVFGSDAPSGSGIPALEDAEEGSVFPSVTLADRSISILLRDWAVTDLSAYVPNGYISL